MHAFRTNKKCSLLLPNLKYKMNSNICNVNDEPLKHSKEAFDLTAAVHYIVSVGPLRSTSLHMETK